jgi:peptidyl-prolyl cis-trans isomerase D
MAAIGKIRSWGPWLVGIIGLALFGFIATDFTRSCETSSNQARSQVGKVMGEKLSVQDYQLKIEEYKNVLKFLGQDGNEDFLREFAWSDYVRNTILQNEAKELGLGVTEDELKAVLVAGKHPVLGSLPLMREFFNQQTGAFDYNNVTQLYTILQQQGSPDQFEEFDRYWKTVESMLHDQLLAQKYTTLLQACMLSNEASAEIALEGANNDTQILLAMMPYTSVDESQVTIDEKDLKAKYDEKKELFKWNKETRDINYVVCYVQPSATDTANLRNGLVEAMEELKDGSKIAGDIVASHHSSIAYHEKMPYNADGLKRISNQLFEQLDTMSDMQVTAPIIEGNNMLVARLNHRYTDVDSVSFKYIGIPGNSLDDAKQRADSVITVLKGGQSLDSVATAFGQNVNTGWVSANMYQNAETLDPDIQLLYNSVHGATMGEPNYVPMSNQVLLYVVNERRQPVKLYDVVIVNNEIRFSTETEESTYNQFSQFISECKTAADMEKNAAAHGFQLLQQTNLLSNANNLGAGQMLQNTRDAVKWAFASANEGSISEIFRNSAEGRFLAVGVTKIHPVGYLDQQSVNDYLRAEVLKDKRAELLIKKLDGAKNVAQAVAKGADSLTINRISFPQRVNVRGLQELGLSGAVAAVQPGQSSKQVVKGTNGVFVFDVVSRTPREGATLDKRAMESQLMRNLVNLINPNQQYNRYTTIYDVLFDKAKVEDKRYEF